MCRYYLIKKFLANFLVLFRTAALEYCADLNWNPFNWDHDEANLNCHYEYLTRFAMPPSAIRGASHPLFQPILTTRGLRVLFIYFCFPRSSALSFVPSTLAEWKKRSHSLLKKSKLHFDIIHNYVRSLTNWFFSICRILITSAW